MKSWVYPWEDNSCDRPTPSPMVSFLLGGLAGLAFWMAALPLDVVKTQIQSDHLLHPKYKSAFHCTKQIYQKQGLRGFVRGYAPCLARSIPTSASLFMGYELAMSAL